MNYDESKMVYPHLEVEVQGMDAEGMLYEYGEECEEFCYGCPVCEGYYWWRKQRDSA